MGYVMGARSNLTTRVYHQNTNSPGAGELFPLPAQDSLTAGQINGAPFFSTDKIFLFAEPCAFPVSLLDTDYMKELC